MNSAEDLQRALNLLPHGAEFRFIDRLVNLIPGQSGAGNTRFTATSRF